MKILIAVLFALNLSSVAGAKNLLLRQSNVSIESILISPKAVSRIENHSVKVTLLGAGLYSKNFLFYSTVKYVAQLFGSEPERFIRTENDALHSLNQMSDVSIQLTFLSEITAHDLELEFVKALEKNGYDVSSPDLNAFLKSVKQSNNITPHRSITITSRHLSNGSELVAYEDSHNISDLIVGSAGFTNALMSIWLGAPADQSMQELKSALIF
ncbi:MAG: hypothetical protein ABL927_13780 [Bdellovibrionales bacterium]